MQDHQDLMNDFDWAVKLNNRHANLCAFGPKMKKILKNCKKILRFFDQNLYGKLSFSRFLLNIYWIFGSAPKVYIHLEDNTRFLQQFSRFRGGGGRSGVPLPDSTGNFKSVPEIIKMNISFV